jgi:hypothetical protein
MNEREIAVQLITLMTHVEGISEENQLIPPIEVRATDRDGRVSDFQYSPEWDSVDILHEAPRLPVSLRLRDAKGKTIETNITDGTLRPEWIRRFLQ